MIRVLSQDQPSLVSLGEDRPGHGDRGVQAAPGDGGEQTGHHARGRTQ